ncbi:MAG: hypothetical protein COA65_00620 [Rhodospirillaceae bacterium]|nr:MAG: hypothetical protein COA65_00620 [Rhodospirillaceae bacterium]
MPVIFNYKGTLHPNKPPKGGKTKYKVDISDIGNSYERLDGSDVHLLRPKIDYLSVVYDVTDKDDQEGIVSNLVGIKKDAGVPYAKDPPKSSNLFKGYEIELSLFHEPSGSYIDVQARPTSKKQKKFMRFQFIPSVLGKEGLSFMKDELTSIFNDEMAYEKIATQGKVTRVDVACDIINAQISELLFRPRKKGKRHAYYSQEGALETIYMGVKKKDKNSDLYAYDKALQQEEDEIGQTYQGVVHTRVEFRVKTQVPIVKLASLASPLSKLDVFDCVAVAPPEKDHNWWHFVDSCRHRGIDGALDILPDGKRKLYKAALNKSLHTMWNPEKLWSYWPDVLKKSGLLDFKKETSSSGPDCNQLQY